MIKMGRLRYKFINFFSIKKPKNLQKFWLKLIPLIISVKKKIKNIDLLKIDVVLKQCYF